MFGPGASAARGAEANPLSPTPRRHPARTPAMEGERVAEINARTCPAPCRWCWPAASTPPSSKAKAALVREGWTLVTENPAGGRLEAAGQTSRWF